MNKLIILLITTLLFSQQLKVDGNLKVEGNIDASGNPITNVGTPQALTDAINGNVLQDALRDDGPFEYKILNVYSAWQSSYGGFMNSFKWLELNQFDNINPGHSGEMDNYNDITTFSTAIENLFNDGCIPTHQSLCNLAETLKIKI